MRSDRDSRFVFKKNLCELHLIALVCKDAFQSTCPWVITGLLYSALAVSYGELMASFRTALYEEIRATLEIRWGAPPPSAVAWRTRMLDLFMKSYSKLSRTLAVYLPNGDWRMYMDEIGINYYYSL